MCTWRLFLILSYLHNLSLLARPNTACPHRLNIIDVVSILPFFIEMALKSTSFAV